MSLDASKGTKRSLNLFVFIRMWFVPTMRDELIGRTLTCTPIELFPFDLTGISSRGIGGAAKNYTAQAAQNNPSLVAQLNSFDIWENASAEVNATVTSLYRTAYALDKVTIARNAAVASNAPAAVVDNINQMVTLATGAYGAAVGIAPTNAAAIAASLDKTVNAAAFFGFANFLVANPLPPAMTCFYSDGETFIQNSIAFGEFVLLCDPFRPRIASKHHLSPDWITLNSTGGIASYGVDHPNTTSTGFYM